ncbi:ferritin-like domain-containing protein [Lactiplantibacillus plantarum]|uniref:ferritin-like domain-containing protein n=1 Tax=Lactiplantibacillus plantarum TaxID=1590 RepID=UPI0040457996
MTTGAPSSSASATHSAWPAENSTPPPATITGNLALAKRRAAASRSDRKTVLKLLNEALATEIVCVLRYKRHFFMARGLNAEPVAAEFAEHATQEQDHADRLAERIVQLGGEPNLSPKGLLERSHSEYIEGVKGS